MKLCVSFLLIGAGLFFTSCNMTSYHEVYPTLADGRYDSEFPYRGCSPQLERIAESVRMLNCIVFYKSYVFPLDNKVRARDITPETIAEKATKEIYLNRTAAGSATVIYYENKKLAVLTCAHVVNFPDTIITYYTDENRKPTEYVQSIIFKQRQSNYIATIQGAGDLEIVAMDVKNDLVILGQKIDGMQQRNISVFNYPIGKAKELEWGTFVYLFGYPSGFATVTKAIVSSPNRDKYGSFLTDAIINRGFSGGIVLAIRDGVPNFELVGLATMAPAHQEYFLSPVKEGEMLELNTELPFTGTPYIESRINITYGVAPTISTEMIVDFFERNEQQLERKGYFLSSFFRPPPPAQQTE